MPDKMMRNAGRGDDGLAKAIRTSNNGNVRTSKIMNTKRLRHSGDLAGGETITLIDTEKEVVIHSLECHFTNDNISQDTLQVWFGTGTLSQRAYTVLSPEITGSYSSFIIPAFCVYDPLLETLVNEPGMRIVVSKNELQVKGFRVDLQNRGTSPNKMKFVCLYSEVE